LDRVLLHTLRKNKVNLNNGDVVAVASKVVSTAERRIIDLKEIDVSDEAARIATHWRLDRKLAALVMREADIVLGGVPGFILTIKNGILTANAGIDMKNSPLGTAIRWPHDADLSAAVLRRLLGRDFHARLGVIIVDSRVTPLRLGTVGLAIGSSGIVPLRDHRGARDLYGRRVRVTQTAVIDDIASAVHLLMGEAREGVGAVIVKNAPVQLQQKANSKAARLSISRCLITSNVRNPRPTDS
jgi:coenzyme F420-0:L-glutamate ligase